MKSLAPPHFTAHLFTRQPPSALSGGRRRRSRTRVAALVLAALQLVVHAPALALLGGGTGAALAMVIGGAVLTALMLLGMVEADNPALRAQVVDVDEKLAAVEASIAAAEREMDTLLYELYGLTQDERELVEAHRLTIS